MATILLKIAVIATFSVFAAALNLNITAIGARDGSSTLECWQLDTPFVESSVPGTAGSANAFLSDAANISYTIIPPNFDGGLHNAPRNQSVCSSLAHYADPDQAGPAYDKVTC
jgi:hypothetical protein